MNDFIVQKLISPFWELFNIYYTHFLFWFIEIIVFSDNSQCYCYFRINVGHLMKNLAVQKTFLLLTIHELLALSFLSQILNTDTFHIIQSYLLIYFFDMLGYFSQQMNWFMPSISSTGIFYTQMLTYKLLFCYTMPLSFSHHSCFSLCSLSLLYSNN